MLMWMYLLTALISLGCVVYYIGNILSMIMLVLLIIEICGFKDNKYLRRVCFFTVYFSSY